MTRNGFTRVKVLIAFMVICGTTWILFPMFVCGCRPPASAKRSSCQSNLKQIALVCAQYSQENEGRYLAISGGAQGWADALQVYKEGWQVFQCPSGEKPMSQLSSDYFFNPLVAGRSKSQIPFPAETIGFGDGTDNGPTNSWLSSLPNDWKTNENAFPRRHLDGTSYAFADGHVKWLKPEKITTQKPNGTNPTFAVR